MSERPVGLPFEDGPAPRSATMFHSGATGEYDRDRTGGVSWRCAMCDETGASRGAIQHVEGCTFGMLAQFAKPRFGPYTRAVLVVDDQAYIRKSVARMLGMHLTVPVIPLRPVAVGWWIRRTPLAVLSDLHMDPYYGRDLGVLAASLGVPFALMSGSATFAPGVAEDLGVPYVRKPFVPGEPYATVSALLGQ